MRLLWLPEVLRDAGLTVHEVDGWKNRGSSSFEPRGIMCHETRGSRTSTDAGEIRVLLEGSNTAPPPIAQLYLSRSADWHVVASGRCNHALVGWAGPFKGVGNSGLVGIEAQHAAGEPWTPRQYDSYVRGVAAIRRHTGWGIAGHKEHQPYPPPPGQTSTKTDPSFDMNQFRRAVDALIAGGMEDDMAFDELQEARLLSAAERLETIAAMAPEVVYTDPRDGKVRREPNRLATTLLQVQAGLAQLAGRDLVDEDSIVSGVLAGLGTRSAEVVAEALVAAGQDPARLAAALTALAQG